MASGGSATITVVVKVNATTPNGTILINNGAVSGDTFDPNNANNVVTANSPVVAQADLAITNVPSSAKYKSNKPLTYTIRVTNNGPSDALAVVVTDTLPADPAVTYLSDTAGCTLIDNVLTCGLGNMPTGTFKQFNVVIKVSGNRGSLDATATVDSSTTDPNAVNDSATATISF
jgi:uncharacterized repeat protein (TIGR01451 family)